LGLLQGWLDVEAMNILLSCLLHLGWTFNLGLLFVNFYFYIFNQQRFRADTATIPALQASPARCASCSVTLLTFKKSTKKAITSI
jgi:hypothetical protein